MDYQQVMGFYHVARSGSFTRAARLTARTQSALSQQIKALEREFGCLLIERSRGRRFRLTEEGGLFLEYCISVMEGRRDLEEGIAALRGLRKGRVTLAAPFTTLWQLLPGRVKIFRERFPGIDLRILDRPQHEALALVKSGEADIAIASEACSSGDFEMLRWKELDTVLLVPEGHPLDGRAGIKLEEIALYPLIMPPEGMRHGIFARIEESFRAAGVEGTVVLESANVELSSMFVSEGLGVTFASVVAGEPIKNVSNVRFVPVSHGLPKQHLALFTRRKSPLRASASALLDVLLERARGPDASNQ